MTEALKDKIKKIQELILRGATEGEKAAAQKALERIMKAHNIDESQLTSVLFKEYTFKWSTQVEKVLLIQILQFYFPNAFASAVQTHIKRVRVSLVYEEWITIECAYEYFRRHMKKEYSKSVAPQVKKCRKVSTRNKLRKVLDNLFIQKYLIASKLVKEEDVITINAEDMSKAELAARLMVTGVQGGKYNKQVISNLLLEEK